MGSEFIMTEDDRRPGSPSAAEDILELRLKPHPSEEAPWFPLRSHRYKCLRRRGVHRSRPARNAVACRWTSR
jgi:hypothetical protein